MTLQQIARHEAAHFVISWATGCPSLHVDITQSGRRTCNDGEILGRTFGKVGHPTPFDHILDSLAGQVADHWESDGRDILEIEQEHIERIVKDISEGDYLDQDDDDWNYCIRQMAFYVDVLTPEQRNNALLLFMAAIRELLHLCEKQWKESTEHLIQHGQIGFDGNYPDQGEEAEMFFGNWGNDYGEPPETVRSCVARYRSALEALTHEEP